MSTMTFCVIPFRAPHQLHSLMRHYLFTLHSPSGFRQGCLCSRRSLCLLRNQLIPSSFSPLWCSFRVGFVISCNFSNQWRFSAFSFECPWSYSSFIVWYDATCRNLSRSFHSMLMASYVTCQRMLPGITNQTIDCSSLRWDLNCYLAYSMNMVISFELCSILICWGLY